MARHDAGAGVPPSTTDQNQQQDFRRVLGHFATGVTVVTALDAEQRLSGLTANAFTAVSLEPPLVLVCVGPQTRTYQAVQVMRRFVVHVLTAAQEDVARAFAVPAFDRSEICAWHSDEDGYAFLDEWHACLACELQEEFHAGDHAILLGRVRRLAAAQAHTQPLLFYRGTLCAGI